MLVMLTRSARCVKLRTQTRLHTGHFNQTARASVRQLPDRTALLSCLRVRLVPRRQAVGAATRGAGKAASPEPVEGEVLLAFRCVPPLGTRNPANCLRHRHSPPDTF